MFAWTSRSGFSMMGLLSICAPDLWHHLHWPDISSLLSISLDYSFHLGLDTTDSTHQPPTRSYFGDLFCRYRVFSDCTWLPSSSDQPTTCGILTSNFLVEEEICVSTLSISFSCCFWDWLIVIPPPSIGLMGFSCVMSSGYWSSMVTYQTSRVHIVMKLVSYSRE